MPSEDVIKFAISETGGQKRSKKVVCDGNALTLVVLAGKDEVRSESTILRIFSVARRTAGLGEVVGGGL